MNVPEDVPYDTILSRLRALGDPTRLRIVHLIGEVSQRQAQAHRAHGQAEPTPTVSLSAELGLTQPTVSHHMKVLTEVGLVEAHRQGTKVYYSLAPAGFAELSAFLAPLSRPCDDPCDDPGDQPDDE